MLRELAASLRPRASRDPVALFRQLSHQYASSSAPAPDTGTPSQSSGAVDTLRQRLAAGTDQLSCEAPYSQHTHLPVTLAQYSMA